MTSTITYNYTRAHTATHLTDIILGTITDILADLKIDTTLFGRDWKQNEDAIKAWIEEGSLDTVVLECHQPSGTVAPVIEFPVSYTAGGNGNAEFTASRARAARFRAKFDRVPTGTTHRLICTFNAPHTPQPGWGPGQRASTDGLQSITFGTLGSAPRASTGMRYYFS
ncbi:hypothetical protein E0F15_08710 [Frankia sp. B2]|uniref:hypothetical protein n=1 Tax=Frankia TaxID=1854 RepID=UPI0003D01D83|nr:MULTISPECIES: hypothetical protein [Frankia]ESZ99762.1 hypothetical protein CcI6DRAFT_04824 [Frankia sp. CcI6]KDA40999.1 hypothetical protein BMG523Draft_04196 [Frankia sp. BMG5.23]KFB02975.1 hypothetical protein ALLO2DRAFT_04300 [Frankia sp. Allo2]OAA19593.1 hypothetical protein AAY23_110529 [Frankia casuarinae]OHV50404.1 hypothetical protein CgIS1_20440 [Frankia sp. CgIS1]